jgi:pimeloyl-ACP methyl ester carboxylesterase
MKTRISLLIAITFCVVSIARAQTSKEVVVFGQKINYVEAGSGPTVILLHGLGGSTQVWGFNTAALAEKYHVVVPDQIGFGKSDKPFVNYRIRTYVDFLDQFCKQLKIDRATLVGNSMGGWIAAMFTAAFPDRVDKTRARGFGRLCAAEGFRHAHVVCSESDYARGNEASRHESFL